MKTITKRNGEIQEFDFSKIEKAVKSAFAAQKTHFTDEEATIALVLKVVENSVDILFEKGEVNVELIQDAVEKALMSCGQYDVAKSYILYREKHDTIRQWTEGKKKFINKYKGSFNTADATVDDNSNVGGKNVGILNAEIHKSDNIQISRRMTMDKLKELYPDFDSKQYVRDLEHHIIYKHDESSFAGPIAPYCCSISMYPFLTEGIKNLGGLSAAPKNLDSFCGMYINLIFATAAMFAGAVATPEFLLCFDYFARKEWGDDYWSRKDEFHKYGSDLIKLQKLSKTIITTIEDLVPLGGRKTNPQTDVERLAAKLYSSYRDGKLIDDSRTIESVLKQYFQQVVYSINQPAAARGLQSAFVNFSYFDKPFFDGMFGEFKFPDGSSPIWESVCWLQKEFMQWFNKERLRCILTFPVESVTLLYKDGEFVDKDMFNFVCEEYARGHSFFTYISDTVDSLSSCCRLKNKLQTKEFNFTNGNMGVMTGSKSVITLNLNRIVQDWNNMMKSLNNDWTQERARESYPDLYEYLVNILERVYKYHNAYNESLYDMYNSKLLPVYSAGFISLDKQYLTIGLNGLNQAAEFLGIQCNDNPEYKEFCQFIFSTIKEQNLLHKTKRTTFNTEQVPAESLAVKNYNWDKEDNYWVPSDTNLYASYVFKPNDPNISVLEKLRLHGKDYIGDYLDGGSAAHINLDSHLSVEQYRKLITYAAENGCQYLTWNVPNSECQDCGWIGKQPVTICPKCGSKHIDWYDRVIGYLTKVNNWSDGRRIEQRSRIYTKKENIQC